MTDREKYDAVIVGAGIAGALIANELAKAQKRVLILEAGQKPDFGDSIDKFYLASIKVPESPYSPDIVSKLGAIVDPNAENAPRPTVLSLFDKVRWQDPKQSYLIQKGSIPFASTYERVFGGTTRHWLGTCLRMLPNDFKMQSHYGHSVDWPITYDELSPWYSKAEKEIGVSANKDEQAYLGITFDPSYAYPNPKIPQTILDLKISQSVAEMMMFDRPLTVTSTPQGREKWCQGFSNCIPICPIQAKYDATRTLDNLNKENVTILCQRVATEVMIDPETGRISGIRYVHYEGEGDSVQKTPDTAVGTIYVLAAHAIETPKLLLNSNQQIPQGVANSSDLVGRNLMDHPFYLAWGLMPDPVYPYRGPLSTSGIESLRDGSFRKDRAAFRIDIGNEGWNFPKGDPYTTTRDFIDGTNNSGLNHDRVKLFGQELVNQLNQTLIRQFRIGFLVEQSPELSNRIVPSKDYTDNLGIPRPEIHYSLSDYTKNGFVAARQTADAIFAHLGANQFTSNHPDNPRQFIGSDLHEYQYFGAGHIMGTYRMGTSPLNSVVDKYQRSWDHKNLFLVGSGVFPTIGTANPTLTIAALSLWAAETILKDLSQ